MTDATRAQDASGNTAPINAHVCLRTFTQLKPLELYQLLQLRSAVFVLEQRCLYQDIDGADTRAMHLLVWHDKTLLGYGRLLPANQDHSSVRIGRIVVAPEFRTSGHGRWLIQLLRACSSQLWPDCDIELSAQTHLQGLYGSCGFVSISEPYDEDGISHIDMRWQAESK